MAAALRDCSPLVRSLATELHVEHLLNTKFHVFDQSTDELLFQVKDDDWDAMNEMVLVDAKTKPIVKIEECEVRKSFNLLFRIKSHDAPHRELYISRDLDT